jgi:hypothetical protein
VATFLRAKAIDWLIEINAAPPSEDEFLLGVLEASGGV